MDGRWTVGTARVLRGSRAPSRNAATASSARRRVRGIESGGKETAEVRGELVGGGFANFLARASRRRLRRRRGCGRRRGRADGAFGAAAGGTPVGVFVGGVFVGVAAAGDAVGGVTGGKSPTRVGSRGDASLLRMDSREAQSNTHSNSYVSTSLLDSSGEIIPPPTRDNPPRASKAPSRRRESPPARRTDRNRLNIGTRVRRTPSPASTSGEIDG